VWWWWTKVARMKIIDWRAWKKVKESRVVRGFITLPGPVQPITLCTNNIRLKLICSFVFGFSLWVDVGKRWLCWFSYVDDCCPLLCSVAVAAVLSVRNLDWMLSRTIWRNKHDDDDDDNRLPAILSCWCSRA